MASSDEVGSSRIRIGAFFRIARATLNRCRSPPERPAPASATGVSYFLGSLVMNSWACAALAASSISPSVASNRP